MNRTLILTTIIACCLSMSPSVAGEAAAKKKALVTGIAVGAVGALAVGGGAAYLANRSRAVAPDQVQNSTGSIRPSRTILQAAETDDEDECPLKATKLYTRSGKYVKTEKLPICQ